VAFRQTWQWCSSHTVGRSSQDELVAFRRFFHDPGSNLARVLALALAPMPISF